MPVNEEHLKKHKLFNFLRCYVALQYLRQGLIGLCDNIVTRQHKNFLKDLPNFEGSCKNCTLEKLLPFHQHEKKACPCISKRKCFCSKPKLSERNLCPNGGFCSKFFDIIVLEHRFRDPLWKNTDPRKWKECPWSVAVCFINTQGYHDKGTVDEIDCRGLLCIIINDLEFATELQGFPIDGQTDKFKKARDFANCVHHSSNNVISDDITHSCIKLVGSIFEMLSLTDVLHKFQNDSLLAGSQGGLVHQPSGDPESEESKEEGTQLACSNDATISSDQAGEDKGKIASSNGAYFSPHNVETVGSNGGHRSTTNGTLRRHDTSGQNQGFAPVSNAVQTDVQRRTYPARHPEYMDYSQRLGSYARWTRRQPDSDRLCEAGFFFTNQYDLVRCFQCGIGLKDFSEGVDPLLEHVRHSPNCPYLAEYLGNERLSAIKIKCQPQQTTSINGQQQQILTSTDPNYQCRHPKYSTIQARLSSFAGWPRSLMQTPLQLAEAGLYYTGFEDQVRCFMCDGGLRRWDAEDVPWTEHCRWFPDCPFARRVKGGEFIALVQASTAYTNGENENSTNEQYVSSDHDLANTMEQMTLNDPVFKAALQEHKDTCLEMGFQITDINDAVEELIKMGNVNPTIEELLDTIDVRKETQLKENTLEVKHNETPLEENQQLKSLIICMTCHKSNVNALFLPCTHHRLCMECAEPLAKCPVCEKFIRQKIRTYLA